MGKMKNIIIIILSIVCIGLIILVSYLILDSRQKQTNLDSNVSDYTSCVAAGNPILETYPQQCMSKAGKSYTECQCKTDDVIDLSTLEYKSEKGVTVKINDWKNNKTITSPITITGEIPGNWSFESSFPVVLVDWDGKIIAQQTANLKGDWMTDNYAPFTVTLEFDNASINKNGNLILRKDNPSGLSENDDAIEIAVIYE